MGEPDHRKRHFVSQWQFRHVVRAQNAVNRIQMDSVTNNRYRFHRTRDFRRLLLLVKRFLASFYHEECISGTFQQRIKMVSSNLLTNEELLSIPIHIPFSRRKPFTNATTRGVVTIRYKFNASVLF